MPKIKYRDKKFHAATLKIIGTANSIIQDFNSQGYDLTLRQLYYQLVAGGVIPNNEKEYKRLGQTINDARLAGLIDWHHITDRTRNLQSFAHWDTPADIIKLAANSYNVDMWEGQTYRVECWIEKDALSGVIARPSEELDIPYFSCRGYTSQSEMWVASQRLLGYCSHGQIPVILHLGDHDPSGIDMTRDIDDRLKMFMAGTSIKRLALNMDQVRKYNPPPNPAKITDSRCENYMLEHGNESWELDALRPDVIGDLVRNAARQFIDAPLWNEALRRKAEGQHLLESVAQEWDSVAEAFRELE